MEILFSVSLRQPESNLINVQMEFIAPLDFPIVEMPVWTPGSYLVRDYSRHVQQLHAISNEGKLLSQKITKNSWLINAKKGQKVVIFYSLYAFEMTVRTSYFDNRKVMISPASVFMYINNSDLNSKNWIQKVKFVLLDDWKIYTSLIENDGIYSAKNFDELVDSPICGGVQSVLETKDYIYDESGRTIPNKVIIIGDKGDHDIDKFTSDLIKIQDESVRLFGTLPYDRYYWMLFIVGDGGGGLEHKYSNVSIINRWYFNEKENYDRLIALESHEHFHVYNIKRIRPSQLGPFDYSQEVYTKILWVAEGLTSFYDKISLSRAGIINHEEYFKLLSNLIFNLDNIPGRKIYSLKQSSFDAWIKLYKSNENTNNSSVSYYLKGSIMAFCMDIEIRSQSNWEKSLDDFFRGMYREYSMNKDVGYPENEIQHLIEKYTNTDLKEFFNRFIEGTEELDYNHYLLYLGYRIEPELSKYTWTGLKFKDEMIVSFVHSNSPANRAGIYFNDEIISINGFKAAKGGFNRILERVNAFDVLDINLFRDSKLISVKLIVQDPKAEKYEIVPIDNLTDEHINRRKIMLGPYN